MLRAIWSWWAWPVLVVACANEPAGPAPTAPEQTAYLPCSGKLCGEPCSLCPPGDAACTEPQTTRACDPAGQCQPVPFECTPPAPAPGAGQPNAYVPCAGKTCGEPCTICPPGAPDCMETMVVKACNARGECAPTPVECGSKPPDTPGRATPVSPQAPPNPATQP